MKPYSTPEEFITNDLEAKGQRAPDKPGDLMLYAAFYRDELEIMKMDFSPKQIEAEIRRFYDENLAGTS
jgi:hypothetical protein